MTYKTVGCGGTFDHLHAGHKAFLHFAFSVGEKVIIGLTSDVYVQRNKTGQISSYNERKQELEYFLRQEQLIARAAIIPIDSLFGPAVDIDTPIEALAATEETENGALQINREREKKGMLPLPILLMPVIKKDGERISSTKIRAGVIDTEGNVYASMEMKNELLLLPEELRGTLHSPFGNVYTTEGFPLEEVNPERSITVGDATTVLFHKYGLFPKLSIIDFVVQRKKTYVNFTEEGFLGDEEYFEVLNPSGTITPALWQCLETVIARFTEGKKFVVFVEGEEDLAVLPLVLMLPLGYDVYYGQPNQGIVKMHINSSVKEEIKSLLRQFKRA